MKFQNKHMDSKNFEKFDFGHSYVMKNPKLSNCKWCNSLTKWFDGLFQVHVCSEECNHAMWESYKEDQKSKGTYENFEEHFSKIKDELKLITEKDEWKDIIVVVKDQLDYFKDCIDSIKSCTKNYHLYIWDNGSRKETQDYINQLMFEGDTEFSKITTIRSENNTGFVYPNNQLVHMGDSPYVILLNSDTKVFQNWDKLMIDFLEKNHDFAQVGYWGGHLKENGRGFGGSNGFNVDYIPGWCFCISRSTYDDFGLFDDKNLEFAYFEDSDFSLRLKEKGKKIYALHSPLVVHYQNKTVVEVEKERTIDLKATFEKNRAYFECRWKSYLENERCTK